MEGSLRWTASAVMVAAQTAGPNRTAARRRNCQQENPAYSCRTIAMASPAADPAVPGANGEYPHPNHVEMRLANFTRTAGAFPMGSEQTLRKFDRRTRPQRTIFQSSAIPDACLRHFLTCQNVSGGLG